MTLKEAIKILVEEILFERKFPKDIETKIIPKLKAQYGDPYQIKDKEKKREVAAKVFGTAQKILKLKKAKHRKKTKKKE